MEQSGPELDLGVFEDALARKTQWHFVQKPFRRICRLRLRSNEFVGQGYCFTIPLEARLLDLGCFLLAFALIVLGLKQWSGAEGDWIRLLLSTAGVLLLGWMVYQARLYVKESGFYSGGRVFFIAAIPARGGSNYLREEETGFDEIGALQILEYRIWRLRRYELNLVRKDGSRVNLAGHCRYGQLEADAVKLARYLNIFVWDATTNHDGTWRK